MKLAYYQADVVKGSPSDNLKKLEQHLSQTTADIVVLPELFTSGYVFDSKATLSAMAESIPNGVSCQYLVRLAKHYARVIVMGIAESQSEYLYNTAIVVSPDGYLGKYRKIAQTNIDQQYFERGDHLSIFTLNGLRMGIVICFDIWFPELIRAYVNQQVDLLIHIANFGGEQSLLIARARAIENNLPIVTCNRIGTEYGGNIEAYYCGHSQIVDGKGQIIHQADDKETFASVELTILPNQVKNILAVNLATEITAVQQCIIETNLATPLFIE